MKLTSGWRLTRQIIIFTIYFLIVFIPFVFIVYVIVKKNPTCFDKIQNQHEEGVDCNGECNLRCDGTYRDIKVNFSRGLKVTDGKYDIFTLLENFDTSVDFPYVPYNVNFYSFEGKLLGSATGSFSISAQRKAVVFLPNQEIAQYPKTIEFNIEKHKAVKTTIDEPHNLLNVEGWQAQRGANDTLQVVGELKNPYKTEILNLDVYAMLYDDTKTVYAVSSTKVRNIKARESQGVTFSWGNIPTPQNVEFVVVENNN